MRGRLAVLGGALALGLAIGIEAFVRQEAPPGPAPVSSVLPSGPSAEAPRAAPRAACVRDVLPASKARLAWPTAEYRVEGRVEDDVAVEGRLADAEHARAVPRVAVDALPEGTYRLVVGAETLPFVIDRTAPRVVRTDPPPGSCPGERLVVTVAEPSACAPVTCRLRRGGRIAAEAPARAGPEGWACELPMPDAREGEGGDAWQLVVRDAAGNAARLPLAWPTPTLTVEAPAAVAPGEAVGARLIGRPAGGAFEARLLASDDLGERVRTTRRADAEVATLRFTAPDGAQVIGIDAAYRLAPGCPAARPAPAEVAVVEPERAPAPRGGLTLLGGAGDRPPSCGNGITDPGEACDAGGAAASCDADCTRPRCGDGVLNPLAGEQCEPGGLTPGCSDRCTLSCGNGQLDQGEACDGGGETAACDLDCTPAACGDGITNFAAGEQCDDGNAFDGDGCDARCRVPAGFEEEDPALGARRAL